MHNVIVALRTILPLIWDMYVRYKQWQHEQNVEKIRENPEDSWDERFSNKS